MPLIKKIDIFVLKKFLMLFLGSFLICLFVLMMQFMWRYVDDLIGKGLSVEILGKFFWYAGITLVPMALPLSILLSALISFGNMGEQLELTAMKSAGIPLIRIMAPLITLSVLLGLISFDFQNSISPMAQKQLTRMIVTMKETSPAIEIPEGVFYNGIPNVNLYVQTKDAKTGMLYKVIIYKMDQGFENAQIVLADSAQLETTADKHFLRLTVFDGEQFENLQSGSSTMLQGTQVPYDRETFKFKDILITFDSGFDMISADMFNGMARVKNLKELEKGADSIKAVCDSIGRTYYADLDARFISNGTLSKRDSIAALKASGSKKASPDSTYFTLSPDKRLTAVQAALSTTTNIENDLDWKKYPTADGYGNVRRHWIEWHQKFALSLSCLIFFFIGAPLGAIIRKGGLGLPTVMSVIIFIVYYIINTSGMKMARDGLWSIWYGMWISTIVLLPFGLFLTYKANNDSVVFNIDAYLTAVRRFFGIKEGRQILPKEVVIYQPDLVAERQNLDTLAEDCKNYIKEEKLPFAPNYFRIFFTQHEDDAIVQLSQRMEEIIERLSNSRDLHLLNALSNFPELYTHAHVTPFSRRGTNIAAGVIVPVGIFFCSRIWRFRIQMYRDLRLIIKNCETTQQFIDKLLNNKDNNHDSNE